MPCLFLRDEISIIIWQGMNTMGVSIGRAEKKSGLIRSKLS
ncbi:hypothetical protein HMPREF9374_2697 [Desmospora sp. 8437]|nr:hypothetical protein HMPREF9374_2697 [Desmospora sp. 8437]